MKQNHGQAGQNSVEGVLHQYESSGSIKITSPYRAGREDYDNNQFYALFLISFQDSEKWIIYTTTSMRGDRIKENYWDSLNLKEINADISKAFLVYPDSISKDEKKLFIAKNQQTINQDIYTPLDGILSLTEFEAALKDRIFQNKDKGFIKNAEGRAFEQRVANALKNKDNLSFLQGNTNGKITKDLFLMEKILTKIQIKPSEVNSIDATADETVIGCLPSGGSPKTDVLVDIYLKDSEKVTLTISCKNTDSQNVSIAQFDYKTIAFALDPKDNNLRDLLQQAQLIGAPSMMPTETAQKLTEALKPHLTDLGLWLLGGYKGEGEPNTQWASYILVRKNDDAKIEFYFLREYYDLLVASHPNGSFGTPFAWTYASGSKGKNIQFKAKVI